MKIVKNVLLEIHTPILNSNQIPIMKILKLILTSIVILLITSCVQETQLKTITVVVDMNAFENVSKVGIRGGSNPMSWEETMYLSDEDGDGLYETTFEIRSASYDLSFKFVNNNNEFELQDQNNRSIPFDYKPETIIYTTVFNNPQHTITKY